MRTLLLWRKRINGVWSYGGPVGNRYKSFQNNHLYWEDEVERRKKDMELAKLKFKYAQAKAGGYLQ